MEKGLIRVGTSAFTAAGWPQRFYPVEIKPADYLSFCSQQSDRAAESTFYRTPALSTVRSAYAETLPGFIPAAKVPRVITYEKAPVDQEWMPRPAEVFGKIDPINADFAYVRWLGDRKGIETQSKIWTRDLWTAV
jgi:hypothetical protein